MTVPIKERINPRASIQQSKDLWVYAPETSFLYKSTGHKFVPGHLVNGKRVADRWEGNDPFWTFRSKEDPGVGGFCNIFVDDNMALHPTIPQGAYWFRPVLCRYYTVTFPDGSVFDLPPPPIPYSDFFLYELFLNSIGTNYIRKYRPGSSDIGVSQFLGELKEIPRIPAVKLRSRRFLKLAANEYLNVEFGWKPFLQDLYKVILAQQTLDGRLNKIVKNNGIPIRRKRKEVLPRSVSVTEAALHTQDSFGDLVNNPELEGFKILGPQILSDNIPIRLSYLKRTEQEVNQGFVGTFLYYCPDIDTPEWAAQALTKLSGLSLTPSLVWELMPWSWLVDWFTNVGNIMSNLSANSVDNEALFDTSVTYGDLTKDSLVIRVDWDEATFNGITVSAGSEYLEWSQTVTNKTRKECSPFGFGLDPAAFTSRQWAILAALGISRWSKL